MSKIWQRFANLFIADTLFIADKVAQSKKARRQQLRASLP
jgi:hypothetical protein